MRARRFYAASLMVLFLLFGAMTTRAQSQPGGDRPTPPASEQPVVGEPPVAPPADVEAAPANTEETAEGFGEACPEATRYEHFAYYRTIAFIIAILAGLLAIVLPHLVGILYTKTAGGHLFPLLVGTLVAVFAPRLLLYLGSENYIPRLFCAEVEASRHPWFGFYFWLAFLGSYAVSYGVWMYFERKK